MADINADTPWAARQREKLAGLKQKQAIATGEAVERADGEPEVITKKKRKKKKKTG